MSNMDTSRAAAPTFHEVRERIVARYPALTPQLQTIALFALSNLDRMAVDTVAELATRLHVPGSSIVRFAQAMGYSGYLEMKKGFSAHLIYRAQEIEPTSSAGDAPMGWVARGTADARRSLRTLERDLDPVAFRRGVNLLAEARTVFVVAQHRSFSPAVLFTWQMIESGRHCTLLDNMGGFALPQSNLSGADDATLAISFSPYQPSVVQAAQRQREKNGAVVAITDTPLSPLAPHADILFLVPGGAAVATAVLVEALAHAIAENEIGDIRDLADPEYETDHEKTPDPQE